MLSPKINIEAQVRRVSKNSYKELSINFRISPDEYSSEIEEYFFELFELWKPIRLIVAEEAEDMPEVQSMPEEEKTSPEPNTPERNKLLQTLHKYMLIYARQFKTTIDVLKWEIYKTYWVQSRSELSDDDINILLKKYKPLPDSYLTE